MPPLVFWSVAAQVVYLSSRLTSEDLRGAPLLRERCYGASSGGLRKRGYVYM